MNEIERANALVAVHTKANLNSVGQRRADSAASQPA